MTTNLRPNLTVAELAKLCTLRDELHRRAVLSAQIYFSGHPASEADSDADFNIHHEHQFSMSTGRDYLRVIAQTQSGHYLDSIDLPITLLAGKRWEDAIRNWVGAAREANVESRKRSRIAQLQIAIREFPEEAQQILLDLEPPKWKRR